jgi:aldehyde dehydrogenase (NAD+)
MLIDGQWSESASGRRFDVPNPATEATVGSAPDASVADMQRAIAAARRAFDEGPWPRSSRDERARVLRALADAVERRKEELRRLLVAEVGAAPITHDVQLEQPIRMLRHYAELVLGFEFEQPLPSRASATLLGPQLNCSLVYRQPVGVCALIPTWNFPLTVTLQKIGPALAMGCTMVVKPSPWSPLVNLLLADIVAELDLPPGVVNFVTGESTAISEALVSDPRVDKISFTGSVEVGRKIMEAASRTLKRVHLELGGKSVGIYLDADVLDTQPMLACTPLMFHAGQGCAMSTRVLVPEAKHDAFVERMKGFVEAFVKVGDPAEPTTVLGPVIRPERRARIEEYIASGLEEGAKLVTGGGRPKHLARGWFVEPTIFASVPNHIRIAQEEIFGPVVSVIPFRDEAEALRIANDSTYGLAGAIYARDTARAIELAKQIRTGMVWINGGMNLLDAPFGGFKQSGLGRECGRFGLEEYTELQQITWRA